MIAGFCSSVRYGNIRWWLWRPLWNSVLPHLNHFHHPTIWLLCQAILVAGGGRSFKHAPKWQTREFCIQDVAIQCTNWIRAMCKQLPQPWSTHWTKCFFVTIETETNWKMWTAKVTFPSATQLWKRLCLMKYYNIFVITLRAIWLLDGSQFWRVYLCWKRLVSVSWSCIFSLNEMNEYMQTSNGW